MLPRQGLAHPPGKQGALQQGQVGKSHQQRRVHLPPLAQAGAGPTGALVGIEGEHAGGKRLLLVKIAVHATGAFAHQPGAVGFPARPLVIGEDQPRQPVALLKGGFQGLGDAFAFPGGDPHPVDHQIDGFPPAQLAFGRGTGQPIGDFHCFTIVSTTKILADFTATNITATNITAGSLPAAAFAGFLPLPPQQQAGEALAHQRPGQFGQVFRFVQHGGMGRPGTEQGGGHHQPRPLMGGGDFTGQPGGVVSLQGLPAMGAVGPADAGVEQAQVVVDFRGGGHRGAGRAAGVLLVDGDGGGQAVDAVHAGLVHPPQETAGIGGKRFHVARLALGEDGVEGQRGLAGTGHAGDHGQAVGGNGHVDMLEVVLFRAPHHQIAFAFAGQGPGAVFPGHPGGQHLGQHFSGEGVLVFRQLLRGSLGHQPAAVFSAPRPQVDHPVGHLDHVQVVLDHQHGVALLHQGAQAIEQGADVVEVQPGGGLVQQVKRPSRALLAQLGGQLDALGLAAREGGGGLPQLDVAQPHVAQGVQDARGRGHVGEALRGLVHAHLQHVADAVSLVMDLQRFLVEAPPAALLADHLHVAEKLHFDGAQAGPVAGGAPPSLDVEGKTAGLVTPDFGFGHRGEQPADAVQHLGVGGRVAAGRAPDGGLVDLDHLVHQLQPRQAGEVLVPSAASPHRVPAQMGRERRLEDVVHQRGFARAGDPGHRHEHPQGNLHGEIAQVVTPRAVDRDGLARGGLAPGGGHGNGQRAAEVASGNGFRRGFEGLHGALGQHLPALAARAGAQVHYVVGGIDGLLVVLHHEHRVAGVPQALQDFDQLAVVGLMQADGGLVQHVEHALQPRADLGSKADALGLAAGEGGCPPRQGQVAHPHVVEESQPGFDFPEDVLADDSFDR